MESQMLMFRLCLAIISHEGWFSMGSERYPQGSASYRRHNPGNLRSSPYAVGEEGGFAVFANDAMGFFALHWDITQKAKGNTVTGLNGESTIEELIRVYAPDSDGNDSDEYIADVEQKSAISRFTKLRELL